MADMSVPCPWYWLRWTVLSSSLLWYLLCGWHVSTLSLVLTDMDSIEQLIAVIPPQWLTYQYLVPGIDWHGQYWAAHCCDTSSVADMSVPCPWYWLTWTVLSSSGCDTSSVADMSVPCPWYWLTWTVLSSSLLWYFLSGWHVSTLSLVLTDMDSIEQLRLWYLLCGWHVSTLSLVLTDMDSIEQLFTWHGEGGCHAGLLSHKRWTWILSHSGVWFCPHPPKI